MTVLLLKFQRPTILEKKLKCVVFQNKNNFFLRLAPFKIEFQHDNPEIGLIHDFLTPEETQKIKKMAEGKMKSTPYFTTSGPKDYSKDRTSKVMYMNEFVVPEAMAISKRIELVTNFQLSTKKFGSENFQIMNYGLGGMISGHVDSHGAVFNENGHDQDHKSKNKRPKSFTSVKADLHSRQNDRGIFIPPLSSLL